MKELFFIIKESATNDGSYLLVDVVDSPTSTLGKMSEHQAATKDAKIVFISLFVTPGMAAEISKQVNGK